MPAHGRDSAGTFATPLAVATARPPRTAPTASAAPATPATRPDSAASVTTARTTCPGRAPTQRSSASRFWSRVSSTRKVEETITAAAISATAMNASSSRNTESTDSSARASSSARMPAPVRTRTSWPPSPASIARTVAAGSAEVVSTRCQPVVSSQVRAFAGVVSTAERSPSGTAAIALTRTVTAGADVGCTTMEVPTRACSRSASPGGSATSSGRRGGVPSTRRTGLIGPSIAMPCNAFGARPVPSTSTGP